MTKVFVAQHPAEAHLIAGLLTSSGIESEVRGEALFSARGEVPVTPATLPSVWVLDDGRAGEALQILEVRAAELAAGSVAGPPWNCENCGETVEGQFTACWNCNAERS